VGVDVERVDRKTPAERVARRFFAPSEADDVIARDGDDRRERFFGYWTLKEAYIKGRAMGLALPLDAFAFTLDPAPAIRFDARIDDDPAAWRFDRRAITPRHRVAWAIRAFSGERVDVVIREIAAPM